MAWELLACWVQSSPGGSCINSIEFTRSQWLPACSLQRLLILTSRYPSDQFPLFWWVGGKIDSGLASMMFYLRCLKLDLRILEFQWHIYKEAHGLGYLTCGCSHFLWVDSFWVYLQRQSFRVSRKQLFPCTKYINAFKNWILFVQYFKVSCC